MKFNKIRYFDADLSLFAFFLLFCIYPILLFSRLGKLFDIMSVIGE